MRREGRGVREEGWAPGHSVLVLQRTRACWWSGAAAGTASAALARSLLQDSSNPLTRDSKATSAPFILDTFAHTSALLTPWRRVPASEELLTLFMTAAAHCE